MSARGRITLAARFLQGDIAPSKILDRHIFSCILCGGCISRCPLDIDIPLAIHTVRKQLSAFDRRRRIISLLLMRAFRTPSRSFRLLSLFHPLVSLPFFRITKALRDLHLVFPDVSLKDGASLFRVSNPRGRVALFAGCTVNFLYPHIGTAFIRLMRAARFDVVVPRGEACCGAPLFSLGFDDEAAMLAEKNVNLFNRLKVEAVISPCPTCTSYVGNTYRTLYGESVNAVSDISPFAIDSGILHTLQRENPASGGLMEFISGKSLPSGATRLPNILYHDPCHALHHLEVEAEPRRILHNLGISLIEPPDRGCCGFGGTFRFFFDTISRNILARREHDYREADVIVTSCPNCILQFRSRMENRKIIHLIEVLSSLTEDSGKNENLFHIR